MKNKIGMIFLVVISILLLVGTGYNVYAKYVISNEVNINYNTADYYFDVEVDETEITSLPTTVTVTVKNYEEENYTDTNLKYSVSASNSNLDIEISESTGTLTGGSKQEKSFTITIDAKDGVDLGGEKIELEIEFNISTPYTDSETVTLNINLISSYVGYYADIDANGVVDGVIYVDLMQEQSAEYWSPGSTSSTQTKRGTYSYTVLTEDDGVKEYYISQESYTGDFGTNPVISPVSGTTGLERFYVMALTDFETSDYSAFYWYYASYGNGMTDYATITSEDFGTGKTNTANMIDFWNKETYGTQNAKDLWGVIQDEVDDGWFVPSRQEFAAFGAELEITNSNYSSDFGLSSIYWTSSLYGAKNAYRMRMDSGYIGYTPTSTINNHAVRLSKTF